MKPKTLTLISLAILASLLIGAFAFDAFGAKELKLKVKWRPVAYTLGDPVPDPWDAEIFFAPLRDLSEIDTSTILLEGLYSPSGTSTILGSSPPRMSVPFNGNDVIRAVLSKADHMEPGYTYHISLTITGNLKPEYGGNPFSGDGAINLVVPDVSPP
jgi:hypothetical protein